MALTGLQIYKYLPKTNCRDCGFATCMAFALGLASGKTEFSACPHLKPEDRDTLEEASTPPIKIIALGTGERRLELGGETELFRHEKTFYHPTVFAALLEDDLSEAEFRGQVEKLEALAFERVGQTLNIEMTALRNRSGNPEIFAEKAGLLSRLTAKPQVLMSENPASLRRALDIVGGQRPLLYAANPQNWEEMGKLALEFKLPLAVKGADLEELGGLTARLKTLGVTEMVLEGKADSPAQMLFNNVRIRELPLKKQQRSLGYPALNLIETGSAPELLSGSAVCVCKYGGLLIAPLSAAEMVYPLLTLRQNIYTDPQKPIQVAPGLYPIGKPGEKSPLIVTTNFSLTYFMVSGEIEASRIPAHLLVVDTEGTSVLTAWAADKFNGKVIKRALAQFGVDELVKHRQLLIPGYVAVIGGEVEAETSRQVLVGPKEASGLPAFLKSKGAVWE